MQELEGAPSFAVFAKGGLLRSNVAQSPLPDLLLSFLTSRLSALNYELFSPTSKMPPNSTRNSSNSRNLSSVAATSFFFHTNTSPEPFFNRTLKFPSTKNVTGASNFNPPFSTGPSSATHSPFRSINALSYGGIAIGRNPAPNNRSTTRI